MEKLIHILPYLDTMTATDVEQRIIEFYQYYTPEDIYPIEEDSEASSQTDKIVKSLKKILSYFKSNEDYNENTLGSMISSYPDFIPALRFLIGEHETTFRINSSWVLFQNGLCSCKEHPKIHTEKYITSLAQRKKRVAILIAKRFIDAGVFDLLKVFKNLDVNEIHNIVKLLNIYQTKQRLAKLRGHKAEHLLAKELYRLKIPFEPKEKLTILGASDAIVPFLKGREVDIVIPNVEDCRLIIQCSYYQSITGSIASKMVRETRETQTIINKYNERGGNVMFIMLIDGAGWMGMKSMLKNILSIVDEFIQFKTIESKLLPIVVKSGIKVEG